MLELPMATALSYKGTDDFGATVSAYQRKRGTTVSLLQLDSDDDLGVLF